jgi:hypothetical protein
LDRQTIVVDHAKWALSKDRRLAVAITPGSEAEIWKTDEPWDSRQKLPLPFSDIIISPESQFVAGSTPEGDVYVWRAQDKLTSQHQAAVTGVPRSRSLLSRAGLSSDATESSVAKVTALQL